MVQLKDIKPIKSFVEKYISIPYGSIKSYVNRIAFGWKCISIPYGSIKRIALIAYFEQYHEFQFLMVQLKGNSKETDTPGTTNFNSLWFN